MVGEGRVRTAVVGMGGFAQTHHRVIRELEREGICVLVATCDPQPQAFTREQAEWALRERGVRVYEDYRALLEKEAGGLDLVTLPVPIPLHAEMHRACVERGVAVYLEKPPTLDPDEMEMMLQVERNAAKPTAVGFHMMADPTRWRLKREIVAGEFGRVRRVTFAGLWPRSRTYYRRNDWAGRLMIGDRLVLDSCAGNAMAHYLNNLCFWAGAAERSWASVDWVEAELYRAHPIEGVDTVFARGQFSGGIEFRMALSHACAGPAWQVETVECERATLEYVAPNDIRIRRHHGQEERLTPSHPDLWKESIRGSMEFLMGRRHLPFETLEESKAFVELHSLLYVAAGHISDVTPPHAETHTDARGEIFVSIKGVGDAVQAMRSGGCLPSEAGFEWARPGGRATAADTSKLREMVASMAEARRVSPATWRAY